jgi:hypothetical protein
LPAAPPEADPTLLLLLLLLLLAPGCMHAAAQLHTALQKPCTHAA